MNSAEIEQVAHQIQEDYSESAKYWYGRVKDYLEASPSPVPINSALKILRQSLVVDGEIPDIKSSDVECVNRVLNSIGGFGNIDYPLMRRMAQTLIKFRVPAVENIYKDVAALKEEFAGIDYGERDALSVSTFDIVLDDVRLGPFAMLLPRTNLLYPKYSSSIPETIPLNPQWPKCNDEYPHPNVSSNVLCTGDGGDLVGNALREGRIYDYFCTVNLILNTYGYNSPYISLAAWTSDPCYDCGNYSDDTTECEACSNSYCEDCHRVCDCSTTVCLNCNCYNCYGCGESMCSDCVASCKGCGHLYCSGCVIECGNCNEKICSECSVCCEECEISVCSGCKKVCACCENAVCSNCIVNCVQCGENITVSCSVGCSECGKNNCSACPECCDEE